MALTDMELENGTSDEFSHLDIVTFKGPSSYTSGGEAFKAMFQDTVGHAKEPLFVSGNGGVNLVEYDAATGKLIIRKGDGTEASGDLSGTTFRVAVWSK